jgi:MICOS complex subunit MIC10
LDKNFQSNDIFITLSILPGVGLSLGGVFSLFFFKRRMWPLYGGAFFGLGVAYNNCEKALNGK